jgi:hypothetical protein
MADSLMMMIIMMLLFIFISIHYKLLFIVSYIHGLAGRDVFRDKPIIATNELVIYVMCL